MGKRKSSSKAAPKKKSAPLSTTFKCLFCQASNSVSVKLDKTTMFGFLSCKSCGQTFSSPTNSLSQPIDIYCDWVDACEDVRIKQPPKQRAPRGPNPFDHGFAGGASLQLRPNGNEDPDAEGEDDDDIDDDERRAGDPGAAGKGSKGQDRRKQAADDDDDDDDLNEDDEDERRDNGRGDGFKGRRDGAGAAKRQKVREYDDEDDDEEDD